MNGKQGLLDESPEYSAFSTYDVMMWECDDEGIPPSGHFVQQETGGTVVRWKNVSLEFGICLEFGFWFLEFSPTRGFSPLVGSLFYRTISIFPVAIFFPSKNIVTKQSPGGIPETLSCTDSCMPERESLLTSLPKLL